MVLLNDRKTGRTKAVHGAKVPPAISDWQSFIKDSLVGVEPVATFKMIRTQILINDWQSFNKS